VATLEDVPPDQQDWHPRSNKQVLDLVHPSLYPIVYGRTLEYPDGSRNPSELAAIPAPDKDTAMLVSRYTLSEQFSWLPTDFTVSEDGESVRPLGYINNLHPSRHTALYDSLGGVIASFVPLFERTLTDLAHQLPKRTGDSYNYEEVDPLPDLSYIKHHQERIRASRKWENARVVIHPNVSDEGYTGGLEAREGTISLRGRTIQIIIKLANIHLVSPDSRANGLLTEMRYLIKIKIK